MKNGPAPIIVTALFGKGDFAFLNSLRRDHYPHDRNVIEAHLTLLHHLPPSAVDELKSRLNSETRCINTPQARLSKLISIGRGVAFGVESQELTDIRDRLADAFSSLLIPQDQQVWRPHVTIQNKVSPVAAKAVLETLSGDFKPRPLNIAGLASWYYRDGPWEPLSTHKFSG